MQDWTQVIIDSGACSSVVVKNTLDRAIRRINVEKLEDINFRQIIPRFGNYDGNQPPIFAKKMKFQAKDANCAKNVAFDVTFNVIDRELPFVLGHPHRNES